ncbi:hypothetical protein Hanom_Chr06g00552861 [Helianthus anomalus]
MRNIWMGNYRLIINVSRFAMENEARRDNKEGSGKNKGKFHMEQGDSQHTFKQQGRYNGCFFSNSGKSYAETVTGKVNSSASLKEVVAIVGKVKDLWTLRMLNILLKEEKYGDAMIKYLVGLIILLVFQSSLEAD